MRLAGIELENWLCHRRLKQDFTPLTVICGPNESGKSAIRDALAFGLMGTLTRIESKGDRPRLLTSGTAKGTVSVFCGAGDQIAAIRRGVSTGKLQGVGVTVPFEPGTETYAVPFCLDPTLFSMTELNDRRTLLLRVMRVAIDAASIKITLIERGHPRNFVDALKDDQNTDLWVEHCAVAASESRGAWRSITGETYGAVKAEDWKPSLDDVIPPDETLLAQRIRDRDGLIAQANSLRELRGESAERVRARADRGIKLTRLRAQVADLDNVRAKVTEAETALEQARGAKQRANEDLAKINTARPPALVCTKCGTRHVLEGGVLVETFEADSTARYSEADRLNAIAHAKRCDGNIQIAETALKGSRDRLTMAEAAGQQITDLEAEDAADTAREDPDYDAAISKIVDVDLPDLHGQIATMETAKARIEHASANASRAKEAHDAVKAWTSMGEALKPSGIPAELLKEAIAQFNQTLAELAAASEWAPVTLGEDMLLSRGTLPYMMFAESAQWRADLLVTIALAIRSGVKFIVADRFDVLQVSARRPTLIWLYRMVKQHVLDSVIIMGTLSAAPEVPKDVRTFWLGAE